MIDKRPALIARCETAASQAAIRFARDHDLRIAVRGGAHNGAGLSERRRRPRHRPVAAEGHHGRPGRAESASAGARLGEVDAATQPHGLAVPTGIISTRRRRPDPRRRAWLPTRRHGLTVDNLLSAEVVLADGSQVTASADEHPDLFWAIRGGGGNFGVVTEFTFRAHPLETIVGGPTYSAIENADELLMAYREWLPSAPRNVMGLLQPPTRSRPWRRLFLQELHLRKVCGIVWCIDASDEDAEAAMAPLLFDRRAPHPRRRAHADRCAERRVRRPLRPRRPVVLARRLRPGDPRRGGRPGPASGTSACPASRPARTSTRSTAPYRMSKPRTPPWAYRDATWSQVFHRRDPEPANATRSATGRSATPTRSTRTPRARLRQLHDDDEGSARVRRPTARTTTGSQVKAEYDPENIFRVNQNILPA